MPNSNKMIGTFEGKPKTLSFFQYIDSYIRPQNNVEIEVKSQTSYKVFKKFLWMWSYEKRQMGYCFCRFYSTKN